MFYFRMKAVVLIAASLLMNLSEGMKMPCQIGGMSMSNAHTGKDIINQFNCSSLVNVSDLRTPPIIKFNAATKARS